MIHAIVTLLLENILIKGENKVKAINKDNGINQIISPFLHLLYDNCEKNPIKTHINMDPGTEKSSINPLKAVYIFEYPFGKEIKSV